ncbi:MAG: SMC-Scp complex subunit ScpB [Candidatus Thermoplasmatota archaeon]|nr:SMC-Scp complex subunit ScpB [Candidatus Thermoplasmatota archaeon]
MSDKENRLVESVLFSASTPVTINEIKEATGLSRAKVTSALDSLIEEYTVKRKKETSMEVVKAGDKYTMQIKKQYVDQSIMVAQPEIEDQLLKTLALIAFHQPVKQSNLRRMLGTRVYDHVDELVSKKLVYSKPHGSTEMLTTTKRFPEYFGIDTTKPEEIREFLTKKVVDTVKEDSAQEEQ